ncbi:GNAT family N-acetyltransferase [Olivibacter domesticus]|uniref:Putative acetyltransferase n=1 Tax=Olivibacter domesticus TaxID=407022 RepID=A0A1H7KMK5_OLID1|nr:GNAT family N-acetyltransferase [Olivibacter domesticus]SEK87764.1 putative acetyltransferase [Olivibacter domesticus]
MNNKIIYNTNDCANDLLKEMQKLYVDAIQNVCSNEYDQEQRNAWAASVDNIDRWLKIINDQLVVTARCDQTLVGFATLDGDYIDMLFVHMDYQRRGVAQALYGILEKVALTTGVSSIYSHVSKTALGFFLKQKFKIEMEQIVEVKNVEMTNFIMRKYF